MVSSFEVEIRSCACDCDCVCGDFRHYYAMQSFYATLLADERFEGG